MSNALKEAKVNLDEADVNLEKNYLLFIRERMKGVFSDDSSIIGYEKLLIILQTLEFLLSEDVANVKCLVPLRYISAYVYENLSEFMESEDGLRVIDKLVRLNRQLKNQVQV